MVRSKNPLLPTCIGNEVITLNTPVTMNTEVFETKKIKNEMLTI